MSARPPAPSRGRVLGLVAAALSLVMPGLGHLYAQIVPRAVLWFAGNLAVLVIASHGNLETSQRLILFAAMGVGAALDIGVSMRLRHVHGPGA